MDDKKMVDHFQSIITYYKGELIITLANKLRLHEKKLADMLEWMDETKTEYFQEHEDLIAELESADNQLSQYKEEFYAFIGKVM